MSDENVRLPEGHQQVCVWPGTIMEPGQEEEFSKWMQEEFGVRCTYLESIVTGPDKTGPGGRTDVFFSIHADDVGKFAVARLMFGIRWLEDAIASVNGGGTLYPARVKDYCCWKA